jgi:hypothetical protein
MVSNSASLTLHRFCEWQTRLPPEVPFVRHDSALLLTRADLCRAAGSCDTLGLAHSGKACQPSLSCAIVEDNGLSAAFTIAHELGHVYVTTSVSATLQLTKLNNSNSFHRSLGIPHDHDEKCRDMRTNQTNGKYNIMSKMLDFNAFPWTWSNCSRHFITEFLE